MVRKIVAIFWACSLSACASKIEPTQQLAQVPIIFAALKCALATALVKDLEKPEAQRRLDGRVAAGTLTLKVVHTDERKAGVKVVVQPTAPVAGPFVFALGKGTGSITPEISAEKKKTSTIMTELPYSFFLAGSEANTSVCANLSDDHRAKIGLSEWLANVIEGLDFNADYPPRGAIQAIKFSQDFAVVDVSRQGLDFNFVFLATNVGTSSEVNDVQNLSLKIASPSEDHKAPLGAIP